MSDEGIRRIAMSDHASGGSGVPAEGARHLVEVSRQDALDLLSSVTIGRVVFTSHALPAIRPVNHRFLDGQIVIRTRLSASVNGATGTVVAYQADELDPAHRLGWSVVVTATAHAIDDPDRVARYTREVQPWADLPRDVVIGIEPEIVSGCRFVEAT